MKSRLVLLALGLSLALPVAARAEKVQIDTTANTVTVAGGPTGTSTDGSGTVILGGTYQTVFSASATRKGCLIQNPTTASEILKVKVGTMASPFEVPIGGSFACSSEGGLVVTDAITVTAATTAHAFVAVSQ